jgi:formylglycine-generating enzyme required for sulfatase activity
MNAADIGSVVRWCVAWLATGQRCRTAYRWQDDPDAAETFYGVRCVRRSAGPLPQ